MLTIRDFHDAFASGDLATIQAYLQQPHVRTLVCETEASIEANPDIRFIPGETKTPWFFRHLRSRNRRRCGHLHLLEHAARRGHAHVIAWFFHRDRIATMGATLALLLPSLVTFDTSFVSFSPRAPCRDPHILEILLTSDVFLHILSPEQQQAALDSVVADTHSPDLVTLAIAHGARVDRGTTLEAITQHIQNPCVVDAVAREGAFVVGAPVFPHVSIMTRQCGIQALLRHGVDWGTNNYLVTAVEQLTPLYNLVPVFVEDGFADVDARGANGATALMLASQFENSYAHVYDNISREVVELLLSYGADHELTDDQGDTALEYATRARNDAVTDLLRSQSAR